VMYDDVETRLREALNELTDSYAPRYTSGPPAQVDQSAPPRRRSPGRNTNLSALTVVAAAVVAVLVGVGVHHSGDTPFQGVTTGSSNTTSPTVVIESLIGLTPAQARSLLVNEGLILGQQTGKQSTYPTGRVISTNPPPGTTVARGSTVSIVVSLGRARQGSAAGSPILGSAPSKGSAVGSAGATSTRTQPSGIKRRSATTPSTTQPADVTPTTLVAQSPEWAEEGERLIRSVVGMQLPEGESDFAYESSPVDITADGTYTLDFGPVSSSFNPDPTEPGPDGGFALSYEMPPDVHFIIAADGGGSLVTLNGETYFQIQAQVSQLTSPYPQFTGWIYP
jgi:eukaryotic-like serine/threonine-protein kinase